MTSNNYCTTTLTMLIVKIVQIFFNHSMITKICLNTGTVYDGSANCTFYPRPINLIFGLNGAGKTSISRVLMNPERYPASSIQTDSVGLDDCEILVYNEDFIEENFYPTQGSKKKQKGIFTIGKENVQLRKNIEDNYKSIASLEKRMGKCADLKEKLEQYYQVQRSLYIDTLYSHRNYIVQTPLLLCLTKQYRTKADYTGQILHATPSQQEKLEDLIHEAKQLTSKDVSKRPLLIQWNKSLPNHQNSIWEEKIVPLGESSLQALAANLNHYPWIKQGLSYLENTRDICPFCQQELSTEIRSDLYALFDETYKQLCSTLAEQKEKYRIFSAELFKLIMENEALLTTDDSDLNKASKAIYACAHHNLETITRKAETPDISVQLEDISQYIIQYNNEVKRINDIITEENKKLDNIAEAKSGLEARYWSFVRGLCDSTVQNFEKLEKDTSSKRTQHSRIAAELQRRIDNIKATNSQLLEKLTNPFESLNRINSSLTSLGICDIELRYQPTDRTYTLFRKSTNEHVYKSLSEGEKTIITFLYFLELCRGSASGERLTDDQHKIIVVDDPISSLSSNYVYEIAYLLRNLLVQGRDKNLKPKFLQIFVLTHNLYFLNEIASNGFYSAKANYSDGKNITYLWYVSKANNLSSIREMKAKEISNDYQVFWKALRDGFENEVAPRILPNIMRNILEYYFTFINHQETLSKTLSDLADNTNDISIRSLCRYLNRNSHSDPTNVTPYLDIDFKRFILPFGKVFEETNNFDHFKCMASQTMLSLYENYKQSAESSQSTAPLPPPSEASA